VVVAVAGLALAQSAGKPALQNGVTNRVTAGGIIFEAANEPHGLRNPGPDRATYYVIKILPTEPAKAK